MNRSIFAFDTISHMGRREWLVVAFVATLTLLFLPLVVRKVVDFGQGDMQVYFRAGWAVWTGYPLYQVTDHHGWTYHYPPTFALFMGLFANPLPGHPQPSWALPFTASVVVWYLINAVCLLLALHVWANTLERYRPIAARPGFLQGPWLLRLAPLIALLPFIGDGLARGQPAPILLLLVVLFFALYVENRSAGAAFAFALAITIKVFPLVLAVIPLLRRDWKFMVWAAAWGIVLLIGLPVICLGPAATLDLYRVMFNEHLAGIISGSMSPQIAAQVSPGANSSIGVGAVVARIAAGTAFYSAPLPRWASALQLLFNVIVVVAVAILGRGGFWNLRGAQPAAGYPLLVAGSVLFAAIPLMIAFAGPQYVTCAVPLVGVLLVETWRRRGEQAVTGPMIAWASFAWLSMIALEVPWNWVKLIGPMTWALLLLAPASLSLIGRVSLTSDAARPEGERLGGRVAG
ncbi:MAG: glycosyltransferase family 87 protein [Xanthobacteraceae bacterium]|nr:glycosyltransferase family 87 protein [Xanthobacteraceae bacterium]